MIMAKHSEKTVTVIFQQHPDEPGGEVLYVTPAAASLMRDMEAMNAEERQDVLRILRAVKAGLFPHSAAQVEAWTPKQRQSVIRFLPEVTA
ncbi:MULTISPECIES: hypothetical protein [Rhodanobacter]|uniref:hypothetical protein n=1 Tax=Rhodanobacter TaxID=75309 RepID=UPI00041258FF|nr:MULTISPECIES: hypothetical protein [Rhodanobacter]KZC20043.1 hypothetical protein RHOFW104R3_27875 [Rhodanobacter denitrificans]UJJ49560.1 hypothetical protein LRK52_09915 [Rhodanobacter denitrificans]UJM92274.1 hypothetical protein LRK32_09830 [Rhodanobacter denitrificans]UJM95803.1 hypothetical protein LRK44_09835 [Rhodanobacter denitrificans]UJN21366.1 hypothetical protein LRK54_16805 [Rhodanobacter denitrificans]